MYFIPCRDYRGFLVVQFDLIYNPNSHIIVLLILHFLKSLILISPMCNNFSFYYCLRFVPKPHGFG